MKTFGHSFYRVFSRLESMFEVACLSVFFAQSVIRHFIKNSSLQSEFAGSASLIFSIH